MLKKIYILRIYSGHVANRKYFSSIRFKTLFRIKRAART